jgi:hypothetical protein
VVNLNLHRRHLNEAARSAVAASISNMVVGGKETNSANLRNYPATANVKRGENQHSGSANLPTLSGAGLPTGRG